ncbi:hypothetical protein MPSEU_001103800 [Mayamaea pseudoterrestris]|nr:hypothetical protein MPSEU_001103800 [Mayamaea pseudoterrestris]
MAAATTRPICAWALTLWMLASCIHDASAFANVNSSKRQSLGVARAAAASDLGSTVVSKHHYDVVKVDLEDGRDYPIYIGTKFANDEAASILQSHIHGNKVLIVTNDRIAPMYLDKYTQLLASNPQLSVDTLVIPDGEQHKNFDVLQSILDKCLENSLDRKATLVALGGGVIGDMVGFAAAIYQRGVNFVQIPTTVMAMVDSSVGGKTGVNHPMGKNMIGAFHQPQCVFVDTDTLATLPDRELCSGISEIIKYGLIRDAAFFEWQEEHMDELLQRNPEALRYAITRSCQNKAAVVKADEKEAGLRATLNLGHTFGHAIENGSGYGTWLHGEAVAIGTAMATSMSARLGWIDTSLVKRVYDILHRAKLPTELPLDSPMNRDNFLRLMSVDKKVANGQLRLILLKGELGECVFTGNFDNEAMIDTVDEFVAECGAIAK